MASIFSGIQKIFGSKYDRDVKKYSPIVDETNEFFESYRNLSNDALRAKTTEFRDRIKEHLAGIDGDMASIRQEAEDSEDFAAKEEMYKEIDELIEERNKELEAILQEILPEAFAVVKETARRFMDNEFLEVSSTDHDRDLAVDKTYITVDGDKTYWRNSWTAA
jgi:preprotein translocase subunit SecA